MYVLSNQYISILLNYLWCRKDSNRRKCSSFGGTMCWTLLKTAAWTLHWFNSKVVKEMLTNIHRMLQRQVRISHQHWTLPAQTNPPVGVPILRTHTVNSHPVPWGAADWSRAVGERESRCVSSRCVSRTRRRSAHLVARGVFKSCRCHVCHISQVQS